MSVRRFVFRTEDVAKNLLLNMTTLAWFIAGFVLVALFGAAALAIMAVGVCAMVGYALFNDYF